MPISETASVKLELMSSRSAAFTASTVGAPTLKEASVVGHTTSSVPRPHVIYVVRLVYTDGSIAVVGKRFSEFHALYAKLTRGSAKGSRRGSKKDEGTSDALTFPPRRALLTALFPQAWIDDSVLEERKAGLNEFLCLLLNTEKMKGHPALGKFFKTTYTSFAMDALGEGLAQLSVAKKVKGMEGDGDGEVGGNGRPVAASYYPSWAAYTLPPASVDWTKFDIIFFAFAIPTQKGALDWPDNGKETLKKVQSAIRNSRAGTKVVLSVGGWGGSKWFSQVVANPVGRAAFITALAGAVDSFGLYGVDIDWEYPNSPGDGNPHSPADAENFLQFLKALRSRLGNNKIISAAVSHLPWVGANGKPLTSVSEYAKYMTFVNIMNYDVWGSSSNPGPNAPLGDLCHTSGQPEANAKAAFARWTKAGMPASKLLLGLATYGYVSKSQKTKLSGSFKPSLKPGAHPRSKAHMKKPDEETDTRPAGDLSSMWGKQIAFNQLVSMGALVKKSDGTYTSDNGYTMAWDDCSDTPFIFNRQRETVVSYDDTFSLIDKAKYAKEVGMAGCFTWSLDQDDDLTLHEAVKSGLGI